MVDTYEIHKRSDTDRLWNLVRYYDDHEENRQSVIVGVFPSKRSAERAVKQIEAHEDRNFAEAFYRMMLFAKNKLIDQEVCARHMYKVWKKIGAEMSVKEKQDLIGDLAMFAAYLMSQYEHIMDEMKIQDHYEAYYD